MPQKVKGLGFEISLADRIPFGNLAREVMRINGMTLKHWGGAECVVYSDVVDNLFCGLVLCLKDHKKSLNSIKDPDGTYHVRKLQLSEGENGIEAGLFVINPATKKGLFTNHWGGMGASKLKVILRDAHEELRKKVTNQYIEEERTRGVEYKISKKKATAALAGHFDFTVLTDPSDLDEVLDMYRRISSFHVSVKEGLLDAPWLSPVQDQTAGSSMTVGLKKDSNFDTVKKGLKSIFSQKERDRIKALRLIGTSLDGDQMSHLVGYNRVEYFKCDYDEYVDRLPASTYDQFQGCRALADLIQVHNENWAVFGRRPANSNWLPGNEFEGISLG